MFIPLVTAFDLGSVCGFVGVCITLLVVCFSLRFGFTMVFGVLCLVWMLEVWGSCLLLFSVFCFKLALVLFILGFGLGLFCFLIVCYLFSWGFGVVGVLWFVL